MANRNEAEIYINGRRYKISGEESPAYMKKAADYINDVYAELKGIPGFTKKSPDYQNLMMYLNLADKYMKVQGWNEERQAKEDEKEAEEISALKMELVDAQKACEESAAKLKEAENRYQNEVTALNEANEALKVRYSRLQDASRKNEDMVRTMEKEADSSRTEIAILKRKVNEYIKSAVEQDKKIKELEEKVAGGGQAAALKAQIAEMEQKISLMQQDAVNTRNSQQRMREEIEKYKERNAVLTKQINTLAVEREQLDGELKKQTQILNAGYEDRLAEKEKAWKAEAAQMEGRYEDQMAELRAEYENKMSQIRPGYEELLAEQKAELESIRGELAAANEKLKQAEGADDTAKAENERLKKELADGKNALAKAKQELEKSQASEFSSIQESAALKQRIEDLKSQRNSAAKELEAARENLAKMKDAQENAARQAKEKEASEQAAKTAKVITSEKEIEDLKAELERCNTRNSEMENDMIEYLDLIEEKEREIARLKYKLAEESYDAD